MFLFRWNHHEPVNQRTVHGLGSKSISSVLFFTCLWSMVSKWVQFCIFWSFFFKWFKTIFLLLLQVLFGELRPHFLDTCRPDALQTCQPGVYVTEYECTNNIDSSWFVRDASKSFPSGHSSTSFYEAIFLIWFLQARSPRIRSKLLLPTIQCTILLYALLCSISRITDNRHHWWDVLAGAKIGILFASLTVRVHLHYSFFLL